MKQKLGVVIVSYNSASELKTCIQADRSAIKTAGLDDEIVVVETIHTTHQCLLQKQSARGLSQMTPMLVFLRV